MRKQSAVADAAVSQWGNGLALRLNKQVAQTSGMSAGTLVRTTAEPGKIIVKPIIASKPSLEAMLADFDPERHGGEVMAFAPIGKEVIR